MPLFEFKKMMITDLSSKRMVYDPLADSLDLNNIKSDEIKITYYHIKRLNIHQTSKSY